MNTAELSPSAPAPEPISLAGSLDALDARVRSLARERPVATLLGAAALGFVIGKLAARM